MRFKIGDRVLYKANSNARDFTDRGVIDQTVQGRGPDRYMVILQGGTRVTAVDDQLMPAPAGA